MSIDDESLFDDFGNYIGPTPSLAEGETLVGAEDFDTGHVSFEDDDMDVGEDSSLEPQRFRQQIVLHEEKKYYLSAEEVYGPQVETLVQDEDTQPLTEPIIAPVKVNRFQHECSMQELSPTYDVEFLTSLMRTPERVRNIAICGHLHHGKSSLVDVLMASSHRGMVVPETSMARYTDYLFSERSREISIKSKPVTLLLPSLSSTSMVINIMDTPGHVDFNDEVAAALRMVDGVIVVVDVVEGLMYQTEQVLKSALLSGLPMILLINKMERLFLELKLPPTDAYYKIRHVIEEINTFAASCLNDVDANIGQQQQISLFSPEKGNVLFASTQSGWIFSLYSFSLLYLQKSQGGVNCDNNRLDTKSQAEELAKRLWGEVYYHQESGKFWKNRPVEGANKRTFVSFILEPLYKIYGSILTEEREETKASLAPLGIQLKAHEYGMNTKMVLRKALAAFFGSSSVKALVSCAIRVIPNPREGSFYHVVKNLNGSLDSPFSKLAQASDLEAPLIAFASKVYPKGDATQFDVLARVFSGSLVVGQQVRVIGEAATDESSSLVAISALSLPCGRYRIPVKTAPAGCWALISGIDGAVIKSCTLLDVTLSGLCSFTPLQVPNRALMKVAIEPVTPSELPKMLNGLGKISKTYPLLTTKVEDSGEYIIMGSGELYMDCALHDLRLLYADVEVKVADPVAKFAETVAEMSYIKCFANTPNGRNRITIVAEPLEKGLTEALEAGRLPNPRTGLESARELARVLQKDYGWDILAARSVWACGPDDRFGPSILIDDTLPSEVDKETLHLIKDYIIQGFQWACREGPLCEETVRGVKFRLIEAVVAEDAPSRAAGQLIPTVRRACYSAILTATPRLMEPVLRVEVQTQNEFVEAVYAVLAQRRGHVTQDAPKAGTPLYVIRALLPLMDSFGFETDLRIHTQGMAYSQAKHDHWQVVSGDPLDATIKLIPLEPSPAPFLARDYLLKTRRRKGLSEDVKIANFFDEAMLAEIAKEEALSGIKGLQL